MAQLLSNFGKQGVKFGLLTRKVDIEDTSHLSKFFSIAEFTPVFTAGRNPVAFNGSALLKPGSEIQVECIDSDGNSLYIEQAKAAEAQFSDVAKFIVSIHVYDETYNGSGKLVFVGTTKKGESVRWIANITIDKTLPNSSKVRFYTSPSLEVRPLLYPVVDEDLATDVFPPPVYRTPVATANVTSFVISVTVTNGGSGYITPPTVSFSSGGARATANIDISTGRVTSITVTNGGSNYKTTPTVGIYGGGGIEATAKVLLSSKVSSIAVTDRGAGYTDTPPTVTIIGVGTGARATATLNDQGGVQSVTVDNGGNGYSTAPGVTFTSPQKASAPDLNVNIPFNSSFYAFAVEPVKDTNRASIDRKRVTVDYRLVATGLSDTDKKPSLNPTGSFNSQMEGKSITLNISKIQDPFSYQEQSVSLSETFTIKKVIDSQTIILSDAFYRQIGKDFYITNIVQGICQSSYNFIKYNTNAESNLVYQPSPNVTPLLVKQSYAEVVYRNMKTFSGFVARHKLYAKSLFYPGDFQLISDEPVGAVELLTDQITLNKAYDQIGKLYHQTHIDRYWFTSSNDISLEAKSTPINSMRIAGTTDGSEYVIVKVDTIAGNNDNIYYPYNATEYNRQSGSSYNSNFISLKKDALYSLSANVIIEKDSNATADLSFYFTSSTAAIRTEKTFVPNKGLKLGSISTSDNVSTKYFKETQILNFTPTADYYGTLVLIPKNCNVTVSDVSLKVYGDYGFSPDILFINIPFPINIKNEAFELRTELFDINSNQIFSNLRSNQTFDLNGESLNGDKVGGLTTVIGVSGGNNSYVIYADGDLEVKNNIYVPNMDPCDLTPHRFVGWHVPTGDDLVEGGKLCYTIVSELIIDDGDYISLTTVEGDVETTAKSLAIKYDGINSIGRRIYVTPDGVKTYWP